MISDSVGFARLSARLDLLEAEREIVDTIQRYSTAIDDGLDEEWLDCFTSDGVFEVKTRIGVAFEVRGHDALRPFIAGHTKAPHRWHKHLTAAYRIQINGDGATVQSTVLRIDSDDDGVPKVWVFGRYQDSLVREERWRFRHRTISLEGIHPTQVEIMTRVV